MFIYYHYFKSKNKKLYSELSKKHGVKVIHVYRLARGGVVRSNTDYKIVEDLIEAGIITGVI